MEKVCGICGQYLHITEFSKKGKNRWRSYCKNCKSLRNEMLKAKIVELPRLEKGPQIEVRGKLPNGGSYKSFVSYEKANQLVNEKAAYIVNPTLIRKYFDNDTFRKLVFQRFDSRCVYCGGAANTIDHVLPRCHGGISSFQNCVPACAACNRAKGEMHIDEFLYYYDPSTVIPSMSLIDSVRCSLLEVMSKVENIDTHLNVCLKKIENKESVLLKDLTELEELEEVVNELRRTILKYKGPNQTSLV